MDARHATDNIRNYRHDATRKNNPPAAIASEGKLPAAKPTRYSYDPHLPPVLRFDDTGTADRLQELIDKATQQTLTPEEAKVLSEALRNPEPWLEWTGKREQSHWFDVEPVALHMHERVSAQAAIRVATRRDVQRDLFADPEQPYHEAVQFYQHEVGWANRMILGDSLTVMNSLATRENLAGKVQMIYMDPPYGIRYGSNFQPFIKERGVQQTENHLARDPEVVKAYRDTWTLGIHSYLAYLKDRMTIARELLHETGSIFVQIGDENVHRVRAIMDEVFGGDNFASIITYKTRGGVTRRNTIKRMSDYIIWYAKNREEMKFRRLLEVKDEVNTKIYNWIELEDGSRRSMTSRERSDVATIPENSRPFSKISQHSQASGDNDSRNFFGKLWRIPPTSHWRYAPEGARRLYQATRLFPDKTALRSVYYHADYAAVEMGNTWDDTSPEQVPQYVVQTSQTPIRRCMLLTTDPGDIILDPTLGSGTTARVAEEWGRRWITIDTSRVAIALSRQRLLTSSFRFYETMDGSDRIGRSGFKNKTMPHITLRSIAQNASLDPIFAKWDRVVLAKLEAANKALIETSDTLRSKLEAKLVAKRKRRDPHNPVTDADERRWNLPTEKWEHWEVPFDTDEDYPDALRKAVEEYRATWRERMAEVNACIEANADHEVLVDRPEIRRGVVRVSGPFTVESVHPPEDSLGIDSPIGGAPENVVDLDQEQPTNDDASFQSLVRLLRDDGVRFPGNKEMQFVRLDMLNDGSLLHAEGEWHNGHGDASRRVAVSFGPQYGPVTAKQVEDALRAAGRLGYDELLFAGFGFDGAAQYVIRSDPNPNVRLHMAHISPDVNMGDLLKQTRNSQLFSVSGAPRIKLDRKSNGQFIVNMEGVDIYDPIDNSIRSESGGRVPAWFLDSDYDGRTFCITQAFFPNQDAWKNLARDLSKFAEPDTFEAFKGTISLPFRAGEHNRVAVKVIDPRGNEVMSVIEMPEDSNG